MKKLFFIPAAIFALACNSSKKEDKTNNETTTTPSENVSATNPASTPAAGSPSVTYTIDGATITHSASALVSKDKDNLQAGAPFICMINSNNAANNNESLTLNFLLDTKPGTYPVVGVGFLRGKDPNGEMYGGILGGKPTITEYKVNLTECKDLGSNNAGGHRWSLSGTCDEIKVKATPLMLMDKSKNHPQEVILKNISFSNVTFDDNWEEMMEKAMDKMKKDN